MPTTLPLGPGDDVGGQLKPIAGFAQTAPAATSAATPVTVSAPKAAAAPTAPIMEGRFPNRPASSPAPSSEHRSGRLRTSLHTPTATLRHGAESMEGRFPNRPEEAQVSPVNTAPFTDSQFEAAWQRYIIDNAASHLLVNVMRARIPIRITNSGENQHIETLHGASAAFRLTVESAVQEEIITEALPHLLGFLRRALSNDTVTLDIVVNADSSSPATWNEREVLDDMLRRHPSLADTMRTLGLSLR